MRLVGLILLGASVGSAVKLGATVASPTWGPKPLMTKNHAAALVGTPANPDTSQLRCRARFHRSGGDSVQFTGTVKSFDEDEGAGTIVRDRDKLEIPVRTAGLAMGVGALSEGDHVQFDVDTGVDPQARNVMHAW
jgi:cold shock CspA family protein